MAEAIQQLILDSLDLSGTIEDTRTLVLPGQKDVAASQDAQIIVLGVLNSLASREVGHHLVRLVVIRRRFSCR
jgi:phenylalanyl-tRNA synthetase alpha chain